MPVPQTDPGPFLSALGWAGDVGQIPLQVLRGRPGAAGRKLVDVLGDIPDALLPGDWIPHLGDEDPNVRPSELVGIDPAAHPGIAKAVDIVGGAALNPLSYVGLRGGTVKAGLPLTEGAAIPGASGLIQQGKDLLGRGVEKLPENVRKTASNTAAKVRRTLNWLDIPDEGEAIANQAKGRGAQAGEVYSERVRQIYADLTPAEQEAVGEIAHGIQRTGPDRKAWLTIDDADAFLANRPDVRPDVVKKALADRQGLMDMIANEGADAGVNTKGMGSGDYIQRRFSGDHFEDISAPEFITRGAKTPSALRGREEALKSKEGLLKYLQDTPDADLDFNALNVDARRAAQQGKLVQKAELGRAVTGNKDFVLSDPEHRAAMTNAIAEIGKTQPDYAYKLQGLFNGIPPRGDDWFAKGLTGANAAFKKAATMGILVPRIGFNVRNRIGNMWQVLSDDKARGTIGENSKRALGDLFGAFDDGFIKLTGGAKGRWSGSELTQMLDHIDASKKAAGGSIAKFRELLAQHKDGALLQEALDNGVLDNFVSSEELLSRMAKTPRAQMVDNVLDWPAAIGAGLEQRIRLGTFADLRRKGIAKNAAEAAQTVRDSALDYSVPGAENRTLRSFVPFAAFAAGNLKQQGKFIARHPVALAATAPLFGDDDGLPKYDWMQNRMALPVGLDEQQNPQYATGLGLPIEGLTQVPGWNPTDIYGDIVGQLQPALKTAISYSADKDPMTGHKFGQYSKIFGQEAGELGRVANIARGTGLLQPITGPLDQAQQFLDARKSIPERLTQNLTGVRLSSVDPDQAKRQKIESYLDSNPGVASYESYYQRPGEETDPGLSDLLSQLSASKKRLSEKRKAAGSVL